MRERELRRVDLVLKGDQTDQGTCVNCVCIRACVSESMCVSEKALGSVISKGNVVTRVEGDH